MTETLSGEFARELLSSRLIANLATLNPDGTIHLVPMWFLSEDGSVLMPTSGASRKAKNVERDPRSTVMIDDSRGALDVRGITLIGRMDIVRSPASVETNHRIHLKYVTAKGLGLKAVREALASDDVTLRFKPESVTSWNLRESKASRLLLAQREFKPLIPTHNA